MNLASAPLGVHEALRQADGLRASGQSAQAEPLLRRVLKLQPRHAGALHSLGLCHLQSGDYAQARLRFAEAVRVEPRAVLGHVSLAHSLRALGRAPEAIASFRRALALDETHGEALRGLGTTLEESGRFEEAIEVYASVLVRQPEDFEVAFSHANCLLSLHRYGEAAAGFHRALALRPGDLMAKNNLGVALTRLRPADALAVLEEVVASGHPAFEARALSNLGNAWSELDRLDRAIECQERAIALDPALFEARYCLAAALHVSNRQREALAAYDAAIALRPDDSAEARMFRSMARLVCGDFETGWAEYEWRGDGAERLHDARQRASRLAPGTDPAGRSVYVFNEQGNGDTLQFARYAKLLAARGARVTLRVQPALASLMRSLDPAVRVVTAEADAGRNDWCVPVMSLPRFFGTRLDSIPAEVPYLRIDDARRQAWGERLGARSLPRIGVAWAGNSNNINDRRRSVPLADFERLFELPAQFVVLQNDLRLGDRERLAGHANVLERSAQIGDFEDVGAMIEHCDLVVCVDTAVAHLAGALGRPAWVLLPFSPDFRWLLERADSPWYPSLRLFRQERAGQWSGLLTRVAAELPGVASPSGT